MKAGWTRGKVAAVVLVGLGLLRMGADLWGARALAGALGSTLVAPAPRVFSSVRGLETYSTRFFLEWTDRSGARQRLEIDSSVAARIEGPYQRRNVYGAVLAYGPVLQQDPIGRGMLDSVLGVALAGEAPLLRELGVDPTEVEGFVELVYEPLPGTELGELPTRLRAPAPVEARP